MTNKDRLQAEVVEEIKKNNYNGIVLIPTGGGKAKIMVDTTKQLNPQSILYLCDNEELRDKTFKYELHKWDGSYLIPRIDFACYQTAHKWKDKHYDLLLGDEFDFSLTPKYSQVYFNNTFDNKILVSATLNDEKRALAKKIAPIIYEKNQKELIEDNILNNIQPFYINYDLLPTENKKYLEFNERFSKLLKGNGSKNNLEFLKIQRKQFLSSLKSSETVTKWLLNTLSVRNEKTLVFCGLSSQADKIFYNTYHSNNNNTEAFRLFEEGKENILVVVEKITRGVNINDVKNIIHEAPGKAKAKVIQKTGRGMRLDVDDTLNLFFLIPHFKHPFYGRRATIVKDWVEYSTNTMGMSNVKNINYTI